MPLKTGRVKNVRAIEIGVSLCLDMLINEIAQCNMSMSEGLIKFHLENILLKDH